MIFGFIIEAAAIAIYGLIGVLLSEMRKQGIDYNVALRLSVISHIPPLFLTTLLVIINIQLHLNLLWSILLSVGFLFFAVVSQEKVEAS
jgi:hypothetical protein